MLVLGKKLNGKKLIGDPNLFSLEERIFNTVCIIAFITMCFEVPFNFFIGLVVPGFLCVFGVLFSAFLYYLSRFKRKSSLGIKVFCIVCNICFAINYFYNSGIYGPNLLLFALVFLMIVAIIPKAHFKIWLPMNVILVFAILIAEYLDPQLIPNAYANPLNKAIDFGTTYLVVVVLIYFAISYIRENYDYERVSVLKKNIAIETQNTKIIEQNSELERLHIEKDKLFSIVTHDIRSPLSSIQSYLEILTEHDLSQAERISLEQQLLQITRDTSDMLTNVLSWSKTQMEGAHVELTVLSVTEALNTGLSIEKSIAVRKGVKLNVVNNQQLSIIADQNMFQLVLRNLVSNAIKFTQPGGLITVSASEEDGYCCIMVKDNGKGIETKQQEQLFKLKASSTFGTHNEKGIGLGLLLCKEYTDLQDGKIWFESRVNEGSTFFLSFKLA